MILNFLQNLPPELIVFLVSALPISELRGALPLALNIYHLPVVLSYFLAVAGNIFPVIFLLLGLEKISDFLSRKIYFFNRFFAWLFERTRRKHNHSFEKWGEIVLVLFVAIPLPLTGGWTGAVAAFVFGIPFRKALPLISLGIILAGIIVSIASLGLEKFIKTGF